MAELLFLGTGAADWEIENRDGFFRRNSAAMLDNKILLDCGEHIFDFAECADNEKLYDGVECILITHNHSDHINADSVRRIAAKKKIKVVCSKAVQAKIGACENIEYIVLKPFSGLEICGCKIMPVLANHDVVLTEDDASVHYIIETPDGKTMFYGLDGAWFLRPSWEMMKKYKFDLMIFDCTVGDSDDWRIFEHNTIPMLRMMVREIKAREMVSDGGVMIASHLARTLHKPHEETAEILKQLGLDTALDGMKINF